MGYGLWKDGPSDMNRAPGADLLEDDPVARAQEAVWAAARKSPRSIAFRTIRTWATFALMLDAVAAVVVSSQTDSAIGIVVGIVLAAAVLCVALWAALVVRADGGGSP